MRYSIIDMNYNSGLGKVIKKGIPLIPYGITRSPDENVTAVLHKNKNDYWIFSYLDGKILTFLVDTAGFHPYTIFENGSGRIVVSPKRDYIAFGLRLYKFDNATGLLEFVTELPSKSNSVEFSPNGQFLYRTSDQKKGVFLIYQYDLASTNFEASKTFIARGGGYQLSLAPNGKIYNWCGHSKRIEGAIHCPNQPGLNCAFKQEPFYLKDKEIEVEFTQVLTHYLYRENLNCTEPPTTETSELEPPFIKCPFITYPNPSSDLMNIKMESDTLGRFVLSAYDLTGKLIEEFGTVRRSGFQIDTQSWAEGIYILQMRLGDDRQCQTKISVIRP